MRTSPREINGGTLRESALALDLGRLGDYNSILLLVDGTMLPYQFPWCKWEGEANADCGLRIAKSYLVLKSAIRNPQSAFDRID